MQVVHAICTTLHHEEAIKLIEGEVAGPVTAETVRKRIPAFSIEDIEDAMEQLKKR
jgi:hypothetical protein